MIGIVYRARYDPGIVVGGDRFLTRLLEAIAQMRQWGAQVVRDIAGHLPQVVEQRRDSIQHVVDGDGEPVQFIAAAAQRDAIVEFSRDDRLAGARDRIDAPHELHAEKTLFELLELQIAFDLAACRVTYQNISARQIGARILARTQPLVHDLDSLRQSLPTIAVLDGVDVRVDRAE